MDNNFENEKTMVLFFLFLSAVLKAQDYHAIQGSNYAGALGVHNNPASIVNTPYPWDVTLFGLQAKYQTNAVRILDYSLLSSPVNSKFMIKGGQFSRHLFRITPRWETRRWGFYLPLQFNSRSQFWLGAGFKAGPLMLGFHNLGNIFSKTKMANGGGYLAISVKPGKLVTASVQGKKLDCPPY
jgi:hypothetical protein